MLILKQLKLYTWLGFLLKYLCFAIVGNFEHLNLAKWFCSNRFKVKIIKEFLMLFDF